MNRWESTDTPSASGPVITDDKQVPVPTVTEKQRALERIPSLSRELTARAMRTHVPSRHSPIRREVQRDGQLFGTGSHDENRYCAALATLGVQVRQYQP
jgi:hypothetical protein